MDNYMLKKVNIPKPIPEIINHVADIANRDDIPEGVVFLSNTLDWKKIIPPHKYNIIKQKIFHSNLLTKLIREQYGSYLKDHRLNPYIAIFENTDRSSMARYLPHTDPRRMIGFNYYLNYGGNNTTLSVYNESNWEENSTIKDWDELTLIKSYTLNPETWYSFDSKRFHSVENIETKRILISMSPASPIPIPGNPPEYDRALDSFEAITKKYSELFADL
jgi:hypothetical protein